MSVIKITDETSPGSVIRINDTSSSVSVQETSTYVVSTPYVSIEKLTQLKDTPDDVQGKANQALTVKADETGLEFTDFQSQIDSNDSATSAALSSLGAQVATKLNSSNYTAQDVLAKLQTVDGSGSGIDADRLDGKSSGSFLRSDANDTFSGTLTGGDIVAGSIHSDLHTYERVNSLGAGYDLDLLDVCGTYDVNDAINGPTSGWLYVTVIRHSSSDKYVRQEVSKLSGNTSGMSWTRHKNNDVWNSWVKIWSAGNDGAGSGLDADTVDGIQASSFLRSNAADTFTGKLTGNELTLGSSDIMTSAAKLQVNGLMRTGDVYIHEGGSSPTSENKALTNNTGALQWDGDQVWHMGNMGSGSGLSADTLQGVPLVGFARVDQQSFFQNGLRLLNQEAAQATDEGAVIFDSSQGLMINRRQQNVTNATVTILDGANVEGGANVSISNLGSGTTGSSSGTDKFTFSVDQGAGSGLDADTLDGLHANSFVSATDNDTKTGSLKIRNTFYVDNNTTSGTTLRVSTDNSRTYFQSYKTDDSSVSKEFVFSGYGGLDIGEFRVKHGGDYQDIWHSGNDGAGSGLDADTLDGVQGWQLLRSDADDSVAAGVTYSWAATNTAGLNFTNSTYGKSLYIGGWSSSNTSGISRIRCSNDNLHIDSGADGDLYLNSYSAGEVKVHSNIVYHAGNTGDFMKKGADIGNSVDLNTYTSTGMFHQNSNANATSGSNYPIQRAGWLEVFTDGNMAYQRYTEYAGGVVYTRVKYNSSWTGWQGGKVTVSTSAPSGGNDGDVWYQV